VSTINNNILKTIGHHTCKKDGGEVLVLKESPFFAEHNPEEEKFQFLGSGYYFWDNNIELAKVWGKGRYSDDYYVIEIDFELTSENCFDLVGNRYHQIHLLNYIKEYEELTGENKEDWTVNQCIQFLRELNIEDEQVFPYKFVRAVDLLKHTKFKAQHLMKFIDSKENYTIMNPKIVICVFDKEELNLQSKKIVHSS
jgi:hypothetical protein